MKQNKNPIYFVTQYSCSILLLQHNPTFYVSLLSNYILCNILEHEVGLHFTNKGVSVNVWLEHIVYKQNV